MPICHYLCSSWFCPQRLHAWISYYFDEPGEYTVRLIVGDGSESSEVSEIITVVEKELPIITEANHTFTLKIEYVLTNNGSESLKDIECFMRIPQTYYPFQMLEGYKANTANTSEVFDDEWNILAHFEFEGSGIPYVIEGPSVGIYNVPEEEAVFEGVAAVDTGRGQVGIPPKEKRPKKESINFEFKKDSHGRAVGSVKYGYETLWKVNDIRVFKIGTAPPQPAYPTEALPREEIKEAIKTTFRDIQLI